MKTAYGAHSAVLSGDRRFRYTLRRDWSSRLFGLGEHPPSVTWVMLNPSTADASKDDPTIRRCVGFSRAWGFEALTVVNLFAFRATEPRDLCIANFPTGAEFNDAAIVNAVTAPECARVVVAWGRLESHVAKDRAAQVLEALTSPVCGVRQLECLGVTREGFPRHPLMVRADVRPQEYPPKKES